MNNEEGLREIGVELEKDGFGGFTKLNRSLNDLGFLFTVKISSREELALI